eukprot:1113236-Amphidinium_carterae.1
MCIYRVELVAFRSIVRMCGLLAWQGWPEATSETYSLKHNMRGLLAHGIELEVGLATLSIAGATSGRTDHVSMEPEGRKATEIIQMTEPDSAFILGRGAVHQIRRAPGRTDKWVALTKPMLWKAHKKIAFEGSMVLTRSGGKTKSKIARVTSAQSICICMLSSNILSVHTSD